MEGLAGKITSSLHESNFACYNCINGITSTADEYNFTSYNCISNITICGRTVEEDYPSTTTNRRRKESVVGASWPAFPLSFPSSPFPSLSPRRSRPPLRLGSLGQYLSSPSGFGRSRPPNVFWCIVGINLHLSDCLMTMCLFFIKRMSSLFALLRSTVVRVGVGKVHGAPTS